MWKDLLIVAAVLVFCYALLTALNLPMAGALTIVLTVAAIHWRRTRNGSDRMPLGLTRPRSWIQTALAAVGWMALGLVSAGIVGNLATQLLGFPSTDTSHYGELRGDPLQLAVMLLIAWTTAAFGEEIVFRGFLFGKIEAALGASRIATIAAVLIQAACFGLSHILQGLTGVLTTGTVGLVFGYAYARNRNLWPIIIAHGLIDTISLVVLYQKS